MIGRLVRQDSGFTLVEAMVAAMITTLVSAVFYTVFFSFSDDVLRQEQRARALEGLRPAIAELIIELRQAVDLDDDTAIVGSLDADWADLDIVFYSDRFVDTDGPERFRYYLASCAASLCDLVREVTAADVGSGPAWTYSATPRTELILENVLTDGPERLFSGVSWRGGTESQTMECGLAPVCTFEILRIRLRVDPFPDMNEPAVEIREDVRFRNAST